MIPVVTVIGLQIGVLFTGALLTETIFSWPGGATHCRADSSLMYAGQIMEEQSASNLFAAPRHPYTEALNASMPERSDGHSRLATIPGMVPGLLDRPAGCLFAPRCTYAQDSMRTPKSTAAWLTLNVVVQP